VSAFLNRERTAGFYVPSGRTAGLQSAAASSTSPMAMLADVWVVRPE
jgi:hypothetical protein